MSAPTGRPGQESRTLMRYGSVTEKPPGCAACGRVLGSARRRYCSDACRQRAYRRRHALAEEPNPSARSPRHETVSRCPECEERYLGEQYCEDCGTFCRRIGVGGECPHCREPVAMSDLCAD